MKRGMASLNEQPNISLWECEGEEEAMPGQGAGGENEEGKRANLKKKRGTGLSEQQPMIYIGEAPEALLDDLFSWILPSAKVAQMPYHPLVAEPLDFQGREGEEAMVCAPPPKPKQGPPPILAQGYRLRGPKTNAYKQMLAFLQGKDPSGARLAMMIGNPGCGKTTFCRQIFAELGLVVHEDPEFFLEDLPQVEDVLAYHLSTLSTKTLRHKGGERGHVIFIDDLDAAVQIPHKPLRLEALLERLPYKVVVTATQPYDIPQLKRFLATSAQHASLICKLNLYHLRDWQHEEAIQQLFRDRHLSQGLIAQLKLMEDYRQMRVLVDLNTKIIVPMARGGSQPVLNWTDKTHDLFSLYRNLETQLSVINPAAQSKLQPEAIHSLGSLRVLTFVRDNAFATASVLGKRPASGPARDQVDQQFWDLVMLASDMEVYEANTWEPSVNIGLFAVDASIVCSALLGLKKVEALSYQNVQFDRTSFTKKPKRASGDEPGGGGWAPTTYRPQPWEELLVRGRLNRFSQGKATREKSPIDEIEEEEDLFRQTLPLARPPSKRLKQTGYG